MLVKIFSKKILSSKLYNYDEKNKLFKIYVSSNLFLKIYILHICPYERTKNVYSFKKCHDNTRHGYKAAV